jgi:hypothetical protein
MRPSSNSATGASTTTLRPFEVLDLAYIQLGLRNRSQHAQIIEPVGRDFMRREYFRAAEEISLEVQKASLLGSAMNPSRVSTFSASMRQRQGP